LALPREGGFQHGLQRWAYRSRWRASRSRSNRAAPSDPSAIPPQRARKLSGPPPCTARRCPPRNAACRWLPVHARRPHPMLAAPLHEGPHPAQRLIPRSNVALGSPPLTALGRPLLGKGASHPAGREADTSDRDRLQGPFPKRAELHRELDGARLYCSSVTFSSQSMAFPSSASWIAMWVMAVLGAAPCQCF